MLAWMRWTLTNGKPAVQGNFLFLMYHLIKYSVAKYGICLSKQLEYLMILTCIIYSGFSAGTSVAVSSTMFALVLVGRAAFVYPLANFTNCIRKRDSTKIEFRQQVIIATIQAFLAIVKQFLFQNFANSLNSQFIMWWAGLMRGAVTIALSYNQVSCHTPNFSLSA